MRLDMQKICEICVKLDLRYPARSLIDDDYQCALAAEMLPSARDEIKRQAECITKLEADLAYYREGYESEADCLKRVVAVLGTNDAPWLLAKNAIARIADLEIMRDALQARTTNQATCIAEQNAGIKKLKENLSDCWQVHDEQARRIAELEEASVFECQDLYEKIAKQRAALKKLGQAKRERGKALVEERARGNYFDESQDCEGYWWDRNNTDDCTQNQHREVAREQLHREGKI